MSDRPLTIDLNTPVNLADLPGILRKAFWWWLGEITDILPGYSRGVLPKAPEFSCLHVGAGNWRIVGAGRGTDVLEIDSTLDDKGVVDQILHAAPNFSLSQLLVVLPQEQVLRKRIDLPLMPERQLLSAVELQVDRLTPFKAESVRLAVKVTSRDNVEGKVTVDCAITPRAPVDALEERLSRLGFKAARIDVAGEDGLPSGFDLRVHEAPEDGRRPFLIRAALALAAVACWYVAGMMWDFAREQEIASWQLRIDELKPVATASQVLRTRLEGLTEPFEVARRHNPTAVLAPFKELTVLIPDTVRLTELHLSGDLLEIAGLATDASALISTLEKSPQFKDVKFRSPVMRRPEANKDRFEISLKLETAGR